MADDEGRPEALEGAIVSRLAESEGGSRGELEVHVAGEVLERARVEGIWLVGQGGQLAGFDGAVVSLCPRA
jgi:hypothetical protein